MGETMTEKEKKGFSSLKSKLSEWEKAGVRLYLDGTPTTSEYIEKNCVNEDTLYMPDYVTDREGNIKEIRYDRITFQ